MISPDQLGRLHLDEVGALVDAHAAFSLTDWLTLRAGATAGVFASDIGPGGLLVPTAGVMLQVGGSLARPFLVIDAGPAFTGPLVRPFIAVTAGVDFPLSDGITLGPALGYGQVFQPDDALSSTDARFLFGGIVLSYRPTPAAPERARPPAATPNAPVVRRAAPPPIEHEPAAPTSDLLEIIERTLPRDPDRVELLAPVLFALDSAELDPTGVAMLHEVARTLRVRRDVTLVEIEGYADRRGSREHNVALSEARATRVREWLVEHGIDPARLRVAAHGESNPVEAGSAEPEHEQNRRVVFRVLTPSAP